MHRCSFLLLFLFLYLQHFSFCHAEKIPSPLHLKSKQLKNLSILDAFLEQGIEVSLKDPLFEKGVLSTKSGGVIQGPHLRIQAKHLALSLTPTPQIQASGMLLVEYGDFAFVGESICYDVEKKQGTLLFATLGVSPWFFSAERIDLLPDQSYCLHNASVTTSEQRDNEWAFCMETAALDQKKKLLAKHVTFRLFDLPIFWLPWLRVDLPHWIDHPIKYRFRWGGEQGPRFGVSYELFNWEESKAFLRFDYRLNRGPGGGMETNYLSLDKRKFLHTINYLARDSSIEDTSERTRFRFQGLLGYRSFSGCTTLDMSYDKLSDKEMATDYHEKGLELKTGKETQAILRHQEPWAIFHLFARGKFNSFQSVKQELPSFASTLYPYHTQLGHLIFENTTKIGYLGYEYATGLPFVTNFHSTRISVCPKAYTNIQTGWLTWTPEAQGTGIVYSNSPKGSFKWLAQGEFNLRVNTTLIKKTEHYQHTLIPYAHYTYVCEPTVLADRHYIFDLQDGLSDLNSLKVGVRQMLYFFYQNSYPTRHFHLDLFTRLFFHQPSPGTPLPKFYGEFLWDTTTTLRQQIHTGWDIEQNQLDHFTYRIDWTVSKKLAVALEYRKRSRYAFRKSDTKNFFLDTYRPLNELLDSSVSDRRQTLILHTYYQILPNCALRFYLRHGWDRPTEPPYTEWEVDLTTVIRSLWHTKFSYQKREDDHRFAFYFTLSLDRPAICP